MIGAAAAAGIAFVVLRAPRSLEMKVPGPCETRHTVSYPDTDLPPVPPERIVHRYDAAGRLALEQRMNQGDSIAQSTRYEYDEAGNRILEEHTRPGPIQVTAADGTTTTETNQIIRSRWTYDAAGRKVTTTFDEGEGTPPTLHTVHAYDKNGHERSTHSEREGGKSSDTDLEVDDQGRVLTRTSRGKSHPMQRFTYDADGNLLRDAEDYDSDGKPDRTLEHSYDDAGRHLRTVETLHLGKGVVERRERTWTYDDAGNPLELREKLLESPDGGSLLVVETLDYSCWTVKDGVAIDERGAP